MDSMNTFVALGSSEGLGCGERRRGKVEWQPSIGQTMGEPEVVNADDRHAGSKDQRLSRICESRRVGQSSRGSHLSVSGYRLANHSYSSKDPDFTPLASCYIMTYELSQGLKMKIGLAQKWAFSGDSL